MDFIRSKGQARISVCLAFYKGEHFIVQQAESILSNPIDELLISNDNLDAPHPEVLKNLQCNYSRVRLLWGPGKGVSRNFEYLLSEAQGEIIYLSDQDDIWHPNKVEVMNSCFINEPSTNLVISDCQLSNTFGEIIEESLFKLRKPSATLIGLLIQGPLGCCMAIRRTSLDYILPLPFFADQFSMHDWWIACMCSMLGKIQLVDDQLMIYRRHENAFTKLNPNYQKQMNATSIVQMIYWRAMMSLGIAIRLICYRIHG
jgi:glycosyltransferase involved in cell wall biosynthesis